MIGTIILIIVVGIVGAVGWQVWSAARNAKTYQAYWRRAAAEPAASGAIELAALGDSSTEAIGASQPLHGFVGRTASYLERQTGRPVHIRNVSVGGASLRDVMQNQVSRARLDTADIVLVSAPSDYQRRLDPVQYRRDLDALLAALPADRTVMSDLPVMPGRDGYQAIHDELAAKHAVRQADFAAVFNGEGRRLDIFSWLPPHLNDRGYGYWFKAFQPEVATIIREQAL